MIVTSVLVKKDWDSLGLCTHVLQLYDFVTSGRIYTEYRKLTTNEMSSTGWKSHTAQLKVITLFIRFRTYRKMGLLLPSRSIHWTQMTQSEIETCSQSWLGMWCLVYHLWLCLVATEVSPTGGMGATHWPDLVSNLLTSEDRQMWKLLVVRPQSLVQKEFCSLGFLAVAGSLGRLQLWAVKFRVDPRKHPREMKSNPGEMEACQWCTAKHLPAVGSWLWGILRIIRWVVLGYCFWARGKDIYSPLLLCHWCALICCIWEVQFTVTRESFEAKGS